MDERRTFVHDRHGERFDRRGHGEQPHDDRCAGLCLLHHHGQRSQDDRGVCDLVQQLHVTRGTVISATTAGALVTFDGPSYASFLAAGGTFAAGTIVTIAGGFMAGQVVGNGIFNPAGAAVSLAINGVGATATWTGGGNYYIVDGLIAPTTLTLLDTATAGAVNGTTLMISNRDTSGNALTVSDASGPTVLCVIPSNSFAVFISNGVNWTVLMQGSGLNQGNTIPVTHAAPLATLPPNFNALVDTSTGTISTITLGVGAFGDTFRVTDEGNDASTNNITVAPSSGARLEDPNNPGVYQAANTTSVFATNGQTTTWQSNGAGKYKIIATGT